MQLPAAGCAERRGGGSVQPVWHSVAQLGTARCSLGCPRSVGTDRGSTRFHGSGGAGADPARLDAPSPGPTLRQRGTGLRNELTEQNQAA